MMAALRSSELRRVAEHTHAHRHQDWGASSSFLPESTLRSFGPTPGTTNRVDSDPVACSAETNLGELPVRRAPTPPKQSPWRDLTIRSRSWPALGAGGT